MSDDVELLRQLANDGSEAAFSELVVRHLDLVYSTALRVLRGDVHLAQDVVQTVFIDLARKARSIRKGVILEGWLYEAARFAAAKAVRQEQRRRAREQEATTMPESTPEPSIPWEELSPLLDAAMGELRTADRDAVLLRFFRRNDLNTVGAALGISEAAAQKRVERAVHKLRAILSRRGVTLSAGALGALLADSAVRAAPAGLAATLAHASFLGISARCLAAPGFLKLFAATKLQAAAAITMLAASIAAPLLLQHRVKAGLSEQNQMMRQQEGEIAQLTAENQRLGRLLDNAQTLPSADKTELLKLRGEIGRLEKDVEDLRHYQPAIPKTRSEMLAFPARLHSQRVSQFIKQLEAAPAEKIPELRFLTDSDWLSLASRSALDTAGGFSHAASGARALAQNRFVNDLLHPALQQFAKENAGQLPGDLGQLHPYFETVVENEILQRWEIAPTSVLASGVQKALGPEEAWAIGPKAPANAALDGLTVCGLAKVVAFPSRPMGEWLRAR
ncbi:MAG TPA: sigma-70 family RNA polymerase sigma factor [Verrucomicrobiae bacterium]